MCDSVFHAYLHRLAVYPSVAVLGVSPFGSNRILAAGKPQITPTSDHLAGEEGTKIRTWLNHWYLHVNILRQYEGDQEKAIKVQYLVISISFQAVRAVWKNRHLRVGTALWAGMGTWAGVRAVKMRSRWSCWCLGRTIRRVGLIQRGTYWWVRRGVKALALHHRGLVFIFLILSPGRNIMMSRYF